MLILTDNELRVLLDWAYTSIINHFGRGVSVPYDFYWRAGDPVEYFDVSSPPDVEEFVGSLKDELDLLRQSVLNDEIDIPELVLERVAFLLLAISASMGKRN